MLQSRAVSAVVIVVFVAWLGWYIFAPPTDELITLPDNKPKSTRTSSQKTIRENEQTNPPIVAVKALPADPRSLSDSPFRNIDLKVAYVGDASCANCHGEICTSFHQHPMGRSAEIVDGNSPVEVYGILNDVARTTKSIDGTEQYRLSVIRTNESVTHRLQSVDGEGAELPAYDTKVDIAIGSGTHGRSYLTFQDGTLWQSPVSWFSRDSLWDISPGFDLGAGRLRPITSECLFCHVNQCEPIPNRANAFREPLLPIQTSIGCERCHGPGQLHVQERTAANETSGNRSSASIDTSIVNPKHLSPALQSSICEQCHLQGEFRIPRLGRNEFEYRPGLLFDDFVAVYVRHPNMPRENKQVSQIEQLMESKCSTEDNNKLLCTSCHDPHASPEPASRADYYNQKCNQCHQPDACVGPVAERSANGNDCIACHMPKNDSSNVAHTSITDHRIHRDPRKQQDEMPKRKALSPEEVPLQAYHVANGNRSDEETRDLGIALARFANKMPAHAASTERVAKHAIARLQPSVERWPTDFDALRALASAHVHCDENNEAFDAASKAREIRPDDESVLAELARILDATGRFEQSQSITNQLHKQSPHSLEYAISRLLNHLKSNRWNEAESDSRSILARYPLQPMAHLTLAVTLFRKGDQAAGRKEFQTALRLATTAPQKRNFEELFERLKQ